MTDSFIIQKMKCFLKIGESVFYLIKFCAEIILVALFLMAAERCQNGDQISGKNTFSQLFLPLG